MKIKLNSIVFFSLFLFCFLVLSSTAQAYYGPKDYLTEYVTQNYWWNGTAKGADVRKGYVDVAVPNDFDTLQYVRVILSSTTGTDLGNTTSYANVVTSYPTTYSRSTIYVNLTGNVPSQSYNLTNPDTAPTINLSLNYSNYFGGTDIWAGENIWPSGAANPINTIFFNYTIRNPSTSKSLTGVTVILQFNTTSGADGIRDAVNISLGSNTTTISGGSTTTATYISNTDADTDYDRYTWTGDLATSALVYITFNATLTSNSTGNIPLNGNSINLDGAGDKGGLGNYSNPATLTGRTISSKLARGPIRQGVDMQISNSVWYVRGIIKNMANASLNPGGNTLTYNITGWRIYSIDSTTGAPYATANMTGEFNQTATSTYLTTADGQITTMELSRSSNTSWYNTSLSASKPYIASYFDWYVVWNDTQSEFHAGYINTTMDMQTIQKVDQVYLNTITGVLYPDTGNQAATVNDTIYYTGSSSISAGKLTIYSIVPVNTTGGTFHGLFNISTSTIRVYFQNTSGCTGTTCQLGIGNYTNVTTQPTYYGNNGTVVITIADLSSVYIQNSNNKIGRNLSAAGDKIYVTFDVLSNSSMTTGDTYVFTGNSTLTTGSGTYEAENVFSPASIQVSAKRLIGYKDLFVPNPAAPTQINATLNITVQASAGEYIAGIKFTDYVVNGTFGMGNDNLSNYIGNLTVKYCNAAAICGPIQNGTGYNVTWNGTRQLIDGTWVSVYEFINATGDGTFNLTNNQYIQVDYQMNVTTAGTYILPLQIAAFDPTTGESFAAQAFGVIRVDVLPPALPLQITDHDLELAKRVVVGTPAMWIKNFEVYNPNARAIPASFETTVFGDAMQGFVSYYNDQGEKIEENVVFGNVANGKKTMSWESTVNPFETRTYEVRVITPPVMEIDRDVEVLDKLENKMVKLKMDIFLKSFAEETYSNLVLNLPVSYENILEAKDGFGKAMQFTGGKDASSIIVDQVEAGGMKTISLIYKASYPTIIITPDRDRYDLSAPVNLEILVINGGETIDYPYLEVEIYTPGMDVIYSNLEKLKSMEPLEKTQNYEKFVVPANAPGGMYVASAKFREDFTVLASGTGNFLVVGPSVTTPEALQIVAVLSVTLVLVYFSLKRFREIRRTKGILEGTAPIS
jgi:hypothetical protein